MEETHTNTGVNYHPFPAFTGFFQKHELTPCQNLTRCYSCHCYSTFKWKLTTFLPPQADRISQLCITPLPYTMVTIRRITICKQHQNSVAKQRESVLLWWALFNVWVICLFYKQTSQIFRSNWKQYNSFLFHYNESSVSRQTFSSADNNQFSTKIALAQIQTESDLFPKQTWL